MKGGRPYPFPFDILVAASVLTYQQHRDRRASNYLLGIASHDYAANASAPVSAYHDDIGPPFFCLCHDDVRSGLAAPDFKHRGVRLQSVLLNQRRCIAEQLCAAFANAPVNVVG